MFKLALSTKENQYDIVIGEHLFSILQKFLQQNFPTSSVAVVMDEHVKALHYSALKEHLCKIGRMPVEIVLPAGEKTKSFSFLEKVLNQILAARLERNDLLLAFGGGVIGDLTGFAASIARRSMPFIQLPTTILAQIDSSIGGKTGINTCHGKNLIGTFYQPRLVLCDVSYLKTLPLREWRAGYAELAKYGLIHQPDFFAFLEDNGQNLFTDNKLLQKVIYTACQSKANIVTRDEKEKGERALLNLGHSFGHALEGVYHYDPQKIIHGEAVALGICLAFSFSTKLGLCPEEDTKRVEAHFKTMGLPTKVSDLPSPLPKAKALFALMQQDKKNEKGEITLILAKAIGQAFIAKAIDKEKLLDFLKETFDQ